MQYGNALVKARLDRIKSGDLCVTAGQGENGLLGNISQVVPCDLSFGIETMVLLKGGNKYQANVKGNNEVNFIKITKVKPSQLMIANSLLQK